MRKIAILITAHNRKANTLKCLNLLMLNDEIKQESCDIYLTDDGCTDGTPEAIRKQYPNIIIIAGDGNLYWNRGMYKAWENAAIQDYDFYIWLNDDTYVFSTMLKSLTCQSESFHNKAIIVGPTISSDYSKMTYGGRDKLGRLIEVKGFPCVVDHFNGNIVLVPRHVFKTLGNLDYTYRHSKGDFDYGLRAKKMNIKSFQLGEYVGICDAHSSLSKWCNPEYSLKERWITLWKPIGMPPQEAFHFDCVHKNVVVAGFHFMSIIIRCIFPKLWLKKETCMLL